MEKRRFHFFESNFSRIFLILMLLSTASLIGYGFKFVHIHEVNIILVYLMGVLLTAWITQGYFYGIFMSIISTLVFNYLFTEPFFTFSVNDPSYLITFAFMTFTSLMTSMLTTHEKKSAQEALEKEAESLTLFNITNRLTDANNLSEIAKIITRSISEVFNCETGFIIYLEDNIPESFYIQYTYDKVFISREVEYDDRNIHRFEDFREAYYRGEEFYDWPVISHEHNLGIVRIPVTTSKLFSESQRRLLRSIIESTALAMDRYRSNQQQLKLHQESTQERYRGDLLRAISHDIRTPLAGIIGTAEMIKSMSNQADRRFHLSDEIYKNAEWLHALVENILNLTRLQDGRLIINKKFEAIEEVIESALNQISKRYPSREIEVEIPAELVVVPMDVRLIQQVLINLLDNAVKNSQEKSEIRIKVEKDPYDKNIIIRVIDNGIGIAQTDLEKIFELFYTTDSSHSDASYGIGLGLSICKTIILAHGGSIFAKPRKGVKGTEFEIQIPLKMNNE